MEKQPVEGSEGQVPAAVRIQAFCFSVWSPLVGQLTWVGKWRKPPRKLPSRWDALFLAHRMND